MEPRLYERFPQQPRLEEQLNLVLDTYNKNLEIFRASQASGLLVDWTQITHYTLTH